MYDEEEAVPLLTLVSSSPPPSNSLYTVTKARNTNTMGFSVNPPTTYEIEEKISTTPNSPVTSPAPAPANPTASSTSTWTDITNLFKPSPPDWTTPATGVRSEEVQSRMDEAGQAAAHAITVVICVSYAAPLFQTFIDNHSIVAKDMTARS
ncbi:hypothetical protein J4E86_008482 [Alternaria arbusti]|uniref:uncharacterized protein n=1 Tax=Alternaria arbusti TaxID=232088 RepID=UPI0022206341|nr:uncharacterized protein J4E86_008482 [Alternaria arbusti]KAI4947964.1 hypothetical protein J4E86_008482 [Alternaria arbusti]